MRIACAIIALGIGVLVGATLAVPLAEMRLGALADLASRLVWTLQGSPLAPDEADDTWLVEFEWKVALAYAGVIAGVGSLVWGVVVWRGRQGFVAAALAGLVLAGILSPLLLYAQSSDVTANGAVLAGLLYAPLGAASACLIHGIDRALVSRLVA